MSSDERLQLIRSICQRDCGEIVETTEDDIADELSRFDTRPEPPEPEEFSLFFTDLVFEGGQD